MALVSAIIEGLQILSGYLPDGEQLPGAEHDVIYGPLVNITVVSFEHRARLLDLGWHWDAEDEHWYHYV